MGKIKLESVEQKNMKLWEASQIKLAEVGQFWLALKLKAGKLNKMGGEKWKQDSIKGWLHYMLAKWTTIL